MINLMRCIYCKEIINERNMSEEHVFPDAFGCPNSWVLDCVCRKCNNELGGTIDRFLASDSLEGLWRLQKIGSKSKKKIRQLRIKISLPDEGKYLGFGGVIAYADFSSKDSIFLPMQVIYKHDGTKKTILIEEINNDEIIREIQTHKDNLAVFGNDNEAMQEAIRILNSKNIFPRIEKQEGLPETAINQENKLEVIVSSVMDDFIFRAIAKISFNYLAKVHGANYALDSRFDETRNYIQTGNKNRTNIVSIKNGHILNDETKDKGYFEGHIFTIRVVNKEILGQVVLTNVFNFYYEVKLGLQGAIWYDLKSGHGYDFKNNSIVDAMSCSPTFLSMKGFIIPKGALSG